MPYVEDSPASEYSRSMPFTFSRRAAGGHGGFYWVYEQGGIRCGADSTAQLCLAGPREQSSFRRDHPRFVCLDVGAWVDNKDGEGHSAREFGLVCGPHVYLCEYRGGSGVPRSNVSTVQEFFRRMSMARRGLVCHGYARAPEPLNTSTRNDHNLYVILGDLHLPPVEWFHTRTELAVTMQTRTPPSWLSRLPAWQRQRNHLYANYYTNSQMVRESVAARRGSRRTHASDIFGGSGSSLIQFLDGLSGLPADLKSRIRFVQTGDMFEMWFSRHYQFRPGRRRPRWLNANSPNLVGDWGLACIIQNVQVFEAFRRLEAANLGQVIYCWGNHDSYTMRSEITTQLGQQPRVDHYFGLHGDLLIEHGHRFDSSNFDQVHYSATSGPWLSQLCFHVPQVRAVEPTARSLFGGFGPTQRDAHIMGASLWHMYLRYDRQMNPFSIYVMGHTHRRFLRPIAIQAEYHLYPVSR